MIQEQKERRKEADKLCSMSDAFTEPPGDPRSCWVCPKGKEPNVALRPQTAWAHPTSDPRVKPPCLHTHKDSPVQPHVRCPLSRAALGISQRKGKASPDLCPNNGRCPQNAGAPTNDTICRVVETFIRKLWLRVCGRANLLRWLTTLQ